MQKGILVYNPDTKSNFGIEAFRISAEDVVEVKMKSSDAWVDLHIYPPKGVIFVELEVSKDGAVSVLLSNKTIRKIANFKK